MFDTVAIKQNFGQAAMQYDAHANLQRTVRTHCLRLAKPYWQAGSQILDAGCGTGAFTREASQQRWGITQLDMAHGMCRQAARSAPTVNADAQSIPFARNTFDGIFSSLMLQWVDTPGRVFEEMQRILKPRGIVLLSTLADGTLLELREAFSTLDSVPHVSNFMPAHSILEAAGESGLSLSSAQRMPLVEHYPDTIALMRNLQAIGAVNKETSRKRGLSTPRQFARLEEYYRRRYNTPKGLPATWQVLFLVLRKE